MTRAIFVLPDLGEGLMEAQLVRWLVAQGDEVAVDEPVAEVETAKAMVEIPTPYAGVVTELHGTEGEVIAVGAPLISITTTQAATYMEEERAGSGNVLIGYGTTPQPHRRRRNRRAPDTPMPNTATTGLPTSNSPAAAGVPTPRLTGDPATSGQTATVAGATKAINTAASVRSVDTGSDTDGPILPPASPAAGRVAIPPARVGGGRPPVSSPVVRKLAKDNGVDLAGVRGSGPGGLITRADVERAIAAGVDSRTGLGVAERIPLRGIRGAIAARLARSRAEIPEATTWVDVDATELVRLRAEVGDGPGLLAYVARFVVAGLSRHPVLNSTVDDGEIRVFDGVNLGIAVQAERGLVVPVVRDAHRRTTRALDVEIRRVTAAARDGDAQVLSGGSFTLNNYGSFGVDGSAAIINHPEVAILGMGRIIERPWVVGGEIRARHITQLSLVFDHRVCDGGTAAGFLRFVADAVESPQSVLADL